MANEKGTGAKTTRRLKGRTVTYFFINGQLHRKLHINRALDELTAWCYPTGRRVTYPYAEARRRMEPAFRMSEVQKMLNRGRLTLMHAIVNGDIERPQFTYALDEHRKINKYMWSEKNIMEAHAFLSQVHKGRPRKDGLITPMKLPSARELRAMIRNQEVLYVKVDGEFRPTWQAPDI